MGSFIIQPMHDREREPTLSEVPRDPGPDRVTAPAARMASRPTTNTEQGSL